MMKTVFLSKSWPESFWGRYLLSSTPFIWRLIKMAVSRKQNQWRGRNVLIIMLTAVTWWPNPQHCCSYITNRAPGTTCIGSNNDQSCIHQPCPCVEVSVYRSREYITIVVVRLSRWPTEPKECETNDQTKFLFTHPAITISNDFKSVMRINQPTITMALSKKKEYGYSRRWWERLSEIFSPPIQANTDQHSTPVK